MIDIFVSPTSLDELQLCWRKYFYSRKRKLVPFYRPERMEKGTIGHKIMAYYYREIGLNTVRESKKHRETIIEEAVKVGLLEATKTDVEKETLSSLLDTCNSYWRNYGSESWLPMMDDKGEPLVEVPLTKIIHEELDTEEHEGLRVIFNGVIDLLLAPRKSIGATIVDHKFPSRYTDFDPLGNQLALYSAVTGIQDVLRNDIGSQKEGNAHKFLRPSFRYDPTQQVENLQWAVYWALEAHYHDTIEVYPPNPTSCDKFGGCIFRGVCGTMPGAREGVINANFKRGTKFSIYEDDKNVAKATLDQEQTVVALGTAGEMDSAGIQETPKTVRSVQTTSDQDSDSTSEGRESGGQNFVPGAREESAIHEDVRRESDEDSLADRLLRSALERKK